jgi:hypothetical protein
VPTVIDKLGPGEHLVFPEDLCPPDIHLNTCVMQSPTLNLEPMGFAAASVQLIGVARPIPGEVRLVRLANIPDEQTDQETLLFLPEGSTLVLPHAAYYRLQRCAQGRVTIERERAPMPFIPL